MRFRSKLVVALLPLSTLAAACGQHEGVHSSYYTASLRTGPAANPQAPQPQGDQPSDATKASNPSFDSNSGAQPAAQPVGASGGATKDSSGAKTSPPKASPSPAASPTAARTPPKDSARQDPPATKKEEPAAPPEVVPRFSPIAGPLAVCPVLGKIHVWSDFGAPRYTGGYHPHAGNDIFAASGTPIVAPFDGTAVDARNSIGGLAVKVFGRAGYVYNAHLSRYGKLGKVKAGDVIGYVGNTGNARTTPPHNHFEFHPNNGPAVDPFYYLWAACSPDTFPKELLTG